MSEAGGNRDRARTWSVLVLLVAFVAFPVRVGAAEPVQASTDREAWYHVSPLGEQCPLPTPCPALSPRSYPENTLHVERMVGRATAHTFVAFDLTGLPAGARLTGATAMLPIAGADAGTSNAASAALRVCLVQEPIEPASGGPASKQPGYDCETSAGATFADGEQGVFTVDLAPLVAKWAEGTANNGIAIVPDPAQGGPAWHVAFSGRQRTGERITPPITASFVYTLPESTVPAPPAPPTVDNADDASLDTARPEGFVAPPRDFPDPGFVTLTDDVSGPAVELAEAELGVPGDTGLADEQPPALVAPRAPPSFAAPVASGYAYPVVWLLPLLLLLVAGSLAQSLTEEMTVSSQVPLLVRVWQLVRAGPDNPLQ